ncbi:2-methylaconitate cis-trans isomerase PrpF family protein [Streptomyces adustus]|uniref:2-methylaconitate cis-trans isomerase PrpF family protein n=1 Tax=Streptomyces adustus TaxID=1609272 RepID=UPI001EE48EE7|nr:2-methylaconitate cis-trans isomerase PrpF family protein [Streptomyces adustus]
MIGHIAYAHGSPCPTAVLDARQLPQGDHTLKQALTDIRRCLQAAGEGHVLKMALIRPSEHPMYDLDYRFVQALPGEDRFELRGSCGHSILSAVTAAERSGMLGALEVGDRVRVNVLNNGDSVVCEVDEISGDEREFTAYFVRPQAVPVARLLLTGEATTALEAGGARREVSLISSGNPYAFVDARTLGISDHSELFMAGAEFFAALAEIRAAASAHLGWPADGAFPKIAAIMPVEAGRIAARAISVPGWHPTIALTGAVCLGTAIRTPGTIPWRLAREVGCIDGLIDIVTPGGNTAVTAATPDVAGEPALTWVSVSRKRVDFHGSFAMQPSAPCTSRS